MSIERYGEEYVPTCDVCGTELPPEYMFTEAVAAKKAAGWASIKDSDGDWWDVCQNCLPAFISKDF